MKSRVKIRIAPPTVVFFALLLLLDRTALSLVPIAAALCHELGHLVIMYAVGMEVREVRISVFGAEIRSAANYKNELARAAVYAAGGAANILTALIVWAMKFDGKYAELFIACSLALAFINLLPIRSLDDGCILEALISHFAPSHAYSIVTAVSAVTLAALWLIAVYILLVCGGNLSLLLFCGCLFWELIL